MTTTERGVLEAMVAHHAMLADGVARRVATLRASLGNGGSDTATAALVAYLADEVLPHAVAEEHSVYPVAAVREDLAETVAGMRQEHRRLASLVEQLATAPDDTAAAGAAETINTLFAVHVGKENEQILPPLASDPSVDLASVLLQMHALTEAAHDASPTADDVVEPDAETKLVRLLLDAANELVRTGSGDRACRLAAEAWAAVRTPRPDLAVAVTAALHRLVRSATAEPVALVPGPSGAMQGAGAGAVDSGAAGGAGDSGDGDPVLDVRTMAPAQRHETIFASYHALRPGSGFVLVNDHDPKPLRYQFEAEHPGAFSWDELEAGPRVWRVRIGRP